MFVRLLKVGLVLGALLAPWGGGAAAAPEEDTEKADDFEVIEQEKVAYLSVDASPYASVFIDGKSRGVTPIVRLELVPGPHRMVARNSEGATKRFSLLLEAGETETVRVVWE